MMNDAQPTGYVSLGNAYEQYLSAWPPRDGVRTNVEADRLLDLFRAALSRAELQAKVFFPDRAGSYDIPPELWDVAGFPELQILHCNVVSHSPPEWAPYRDRTLFLEENEFVAWLQLNRALPDPDPRDFDDPADLPVWTLLMSLAWIARRNLEAVRWQMEPWRREHGLPAPSVAVMSIANATDEGNEADDPLSALLFFDGMAALKQLKLKAEAGTIVATAIASSTGTAEDMKPRDWTYGTLEFDGQLRERWRVGGVVFTNVTLRQCDLAELWPKIDEAEPPSESNGTKKRGPYRTEAGWIIGLFLEDTNNGNWPGNRPDAVVLSDLYDWGLKQAGSKKRAAKNVTEGQIKSFRQRLSTQSG